MSPSESVRTKPTTTIAATVRLMATPACDSRLRKRESRNMTKAATPGTETATALSTPISVGTSIVSAATHSVAQLSNGTSTSEYVALAFAKIICSSL